MQCKNLQIGNPLGEDFDDSMIDKISKIKLQYNRQLIVGIAIFYHNRQIEKIHNLCQTTMSKYYYAVWEELFEIPQDDYLQKIEGTIDGQYITSLKFQTYYGKSSQLYGNNQGQPFLLDSYGDTFSSVSGSFDKNGITSLCFKIQPLNVSVFEQIKYDTFQRFTSLYPNKYIIKYPQFLNYPFD